MKISLISKIRLRIRHFLRKSRHRAWRIHWHVTLVIALLLAIPIGFYIYYDNVIFPRHLKYLSLYDDDWDLHYYVTIPLFVCWGVATGLFMYLWNKQDKKDSEKRAKEWEKFSAKHGISDYRSKESPNLADVVIELRERKEKGERQPILKEDQEQEYKDDISESEVVVLSESETTVEQEPTEETIQKPARKPRRESRRIKQIYRDYMERENPYKKFLKAREEAVRHIQEILDNRPTKGLLGDAYLFTTDETDTLFEGFSIVYGNQVLAVQITYPEPYLQRGTNMVRHYRGGASGWKWERERFIDRCQQNRLIPCIYEVDPITLQPMDANGWNLRNALTEESIIPPRLVTAELIDMSAWELETQMIQFVREYQQQEEEELKFYRDNRKGNILWMRRKGRKNDEWVIAKRVNKFTQLTDAQKERLRNSEFSLYRKNGYLAQIIYMKENTKGWLSPVDHPKRGVNYQMEFEGLQPLQKGAAGFK